MTEDEQLEADIARVAALRGAMPQRKHGAPRIDEHTEARWDSLIASPYLDHAGDFEVYEKLPPGSRRFLQGLPFDVSARVYAGILAMHGHDEIAAARFVSKSLADLCASLEKRLRREMQASRDGRKPRSNPFRLSSRARP